MFWIFFSFVIVYQLMCILYYLQYFQYVTFIRQIYNYRHYSTDVTFIGFQMTKILKSRLKYRFMYFTRSELLYIVPICRCSDSKSQRSLT